MLKTFGMHSKWKNIELHWKCILTALWLLSKYSTAFQQHSTLSDLIRGRIEMASHFVAPSSSWYRACLSLAPLSAPTHQTWQAPSWGRPSWRKTVGLLLWAIPSVWRNVHTTSFSFLPAMDWSDIFWVFSVFFSWPPPHLFQADLSEGQQCWAKQHRPAGPYSTAVD